MVPDRSSPFHLLVVQGSTRIAIAIPIPTGTHSSARMKSLTRIDVLLHCRVLPFPSIIFCCFSDNDDEVVSDLHS